MSKVKQGNDSIRYAYGYDHQRIRMEERIGTSRTKDYVGSCEYVTETLLNTTTQMLNTYLVGPFGVFAVVTMAGDEAYHYVLKDNLGSWVAITDKNGAVVQQLSYDAWGNLRNPNNWANYTLNDIIEKPMFDRGFTGHEHLCHFSLINMNGRMYDPVTSSFLSADRYVQDPTSAMGFNRYAYCMYNPLRFVDPTGWLAGHGGGGYPRSVSGLIQDYLSDPCYVTREQLKEAGIYNIEGGYGYAGGGGTMDAYWMDGFGTCHYSSWYIQTEGGGFDAGAWAIPVSFNPMWVNDCQGYCDYGGVYLENAGTANGMRIGSYSSGVFNGGYWAITNHYSVGKVGVLPLDADNIRGYSATQLAHYNMGYNVTISNVYDKKTHLFSNNQICISVTGISSNTLVIGDVHASAKASLYVDDILIDSKPLTIDTQLSMINPINANYIGSASFIIPSADSILLEIHGGWRVNTGAGWVIPNATVFGPTINANKTIEINP